MTGLPMRVPGSSAVGIAIFLEYHRRILKGEFGAIPESIKQDALDMRGYCIDAPTRMPAGGCESYQVDAESSIPCQIEFERGTT